MKDYLRYVSLGFEIVATMLLSYFLGDYLDTKFATKPWLLIVLMLLACVAVIWRLVTVTAPKKDE